MSKTELEEDLRATFERAAASVPPAPDLAGRATTGVRQAQRRTWLASGAAAAAIAVVAGVGFTLNHGSTATPPPAPAASNPAPVTAAAIPAAQALPGTWRPVKLSGFSTLKEGRPEDPTLTFRTDGTWIGSDGCNSLGGTFTIGQRGEFTSHAKGQRLIECGNVPHTTILAAARRITADESTLKFFTGDGREVATYARAR